MVILRGSFMENFGFRIQAARLAFKLNLISRALLELSKPLLKFLDLYHVAPGFSELKAAEIIEQFTRELKSRYPHVRFVVIPFPFFESNQPQLYQQRSFDYSALSLGLDRKHKDNYFLKYDEHPNSKLTEILAQKLGDLYLSEARIK